MLRERFAIDWLYMVWGLCPLGLCQHPITTPNPKGGSRLYPYPVLCAR
jgi:hypothetical protein